MLAGHEKTPWLPRRTRSARFRRLRRSASWSSGQLPGTRGGDSTRTYAAARSVPHLVPRSTAGPTATARPLRRAQVSRAAGRLSRSRL